MIKYCFSIVIILLVCFLNVTKVSATLSTKHTVTYEIANNLQAKVSHVVKVIYNDKYNGISKISIEEVTNDIEELTKLLSKTSYKLSKNDNKIDIEFDDLLVGPIEFDISYTYKTNSLIKKIGNTYTLELPKVSGVEIQEYLLKVYLPQNIPLVDFKNKTNTDLKGTYLLFTKAELENSGKSLNFGKEIFYELSVKHLISAEKNYIVIPPTIKDRQEVYIESISKNPDKIFKDYDNNLIFEYKSQQNIESITGKYLIKVFGNKSPDTITNYKNFLQPVKNWNFKLGLPLEITKKIVDSANPIENAFYQTINSLKYSSSSISYNSNLRIGAENLNKDNVNNAVCLEYSDLLIAVLRGIGIPAREINGLNYKNNSNFYSEAELHSWVEYFVNGSWVQVDPTFADTSDEDYFNNFDLLHIAFLRRSLNSEYPILTGSYAKNNLTEQLKISTINVPNKIKVEVKYIDLYFGYFVLNDSLSYIGKIFPKSNAFVNKNEFNLIKNYSTEFFVVQTTKAPIIEILKSERKVIVISVISLFISTIIFYILHIKLKKSVKVKKDKVSRIV